MRESLREDNKEIIVLDTAGLFIISSFTAYKNLITVSEAVEEVLDIESKKDLDLVLESGRLIVGKPSQKYVEEIIRKAREMKILEALSETDIKILALAKELSEKGYKVTIVSDDSFIHRVARELNIKTVNVKRRVTGRSLVRTYVCPVCGYKTLKRLEKCPICGSKLKATKQQKDL
ncbi:MAG: hypothetical protein GU359_06905 [Desulfurococcales archaeon]|jgi:UPF0271 protein|nr:hypothetical protein [Desulfurococcales archaeon]